MAINADEKDFWDFMSIAKISDSLLLAQRLIEAYKILQNWESGCKIAEFALELIPAYTPRFLQFSDAQALLSRINGLASFGAAFSLQSRKRDGHSLTMLERGRGITADLLYDLRLDFDSRKFADLKPEFKQKLLSSIGQLENVTPRVNHLPGLASDGPSSGLVELTKRLEASKMVNEFTKGWNTRLKPDNIGFSPLTKNGPIVIINVSFRCDAFIIKHVIETMPLPELTQEQIEQRLRAGDLGSTKTLEWLWNAVAGPILDYLGYTETPCNNEWPQICWITTGALDRFPLHSAGYHTDGSRRTVIDRAMSSYSSSLNAILEAPVKDQQDSSTKAVLVAMQNTPGTTSVLPYAPKELTIVRDICNSMQLNPVEPERRTQQVLAQLKDCEIFHFAGHGETDETNPLKSQLRLDDWQTQPLTVSDLLNLNLRDSPPFLAYLSACGTSQIKDKRLLDESLHLISACKLAGFRNVVGTLWEVGDKACVDVAETVYKELRDSSMDDYSVCRGLHKATRKLRDSWLVEVHMRTVRRGHNDSIGEDQKGSVDRSARDIIPMDDYKNERPAPWVAYVYYGSRR
ncbi:Ff.00g115120.m01.CDS01 [Fusarium sp. VM40]|nr:Ff.00g115120.m01.CDS01 [Fusarium sp. VM40]